jgi:hypothetical protein
MVGAVAGQASAAALWTGQGVTPEARGPKGAWVDSGSVVFDRYHLQERIGAGGMSVVWRATDLLLDQPVALKRVSLVGMDDQHAELTRDRALREARLAARLRHHRHVVAIYDVRVDDGDVWLVLEYLPCRSLAQILRERGRLEPSQAARIGAQVADALAAAHALGIEHRDVTPGNVLITEDGTARLTDFGISHLAGDTQLTATGVVIGTVAYLAPEVARSGKSSATSDVFSLGSTVYAAIEGQPPFGTADNALELLRIVGGGIIRPPTAAGEFTPLLLRLLALDPATRPDADTVRDTLTAFASQPKDPAQFPETAPEQPRRWMVRRPVPTVMLALIMVAVLVGGTMLVLARRGDNVTATGVPALPPTVGPITLTGDPKAADPCALVNSGSLRQFGHPVLDIGGGLEGCRALITAPGGDVYLTVAFDVAKPGWDVDPDGPVQRLGGLSIVREGVIPKDQKICRNALVLADLTQINIQSNGDANNSCAVTGVATAVAVNELARGGIRYRPGRTAGLLIAASDACKVLDDATLNKLGVDADLRDPGFANWSCAWGPAKKAHRMST